MSSSEEGKKGYHQAEGKRGHQLKKTIEGKRGHHQGQEGHHQGEDVPAGHQKSWKRKGAAIKGYEKEEKKDGPPKIGMGRRETTKEKEKKGGR